MADAKKIAIHNTKTSVNYLTVKTQILQNRINGHLETDGALHAEKFKRAEHYLAYAIAHLKDAEASLS